MMQDTTLRMVVQAVDQASAPLSNIKAQLDEVTGGLDGATSAARTAVPEMNKNLEELGEGFEDVGESAAKAAFHIGPGTIEAIAAAGFAFVMLINYLKDVVKEHQRVSDLATTLQLPYDEVKRYSDAWEEVALQLNEAARGYARLKDAQIASFAAVGLDPTNLTQSKDLAGSIAVGKGTEREKIDALRRLFGVNEGQSMANFSQNSFIVTLATENPSIQGSPFEALLTYYLARKTSNL